MASSAAVSEVRAWAKTNGFDIGDRGRLPAEVWDAWTAAAKPPKRRADSRPQAESAAAPAPKVDQAQLREARERIARLEAELGQLTSRIAAIEQKAEATPQPRRRFVRNR